jgi:hypothetical protein
VNYTGEPEAIRAFLCIVGAMAITGLIAFLVERSRPVKPPYKHEYDFWKPDAEPEDQ